jgi:hypothetical protein
MTFMCPAAAVAGENGMIDRSRIAGKRASKRNGLAAQSAATDDNSRNLGTAPSLVSVTENGLLFVACVRASHKAVILVE